MALMTSMRVRMHVVLWALLALFLLSMTIGGLVGGANIIDQLFGNVNPQTTIARINGENISPDNFNNRVSQQLQNSRSAGQNINDCVSICSTITPPLHFEVIFPLIVSFSSYAFSKFGFLLQVFFISSKFSINL